MQQTRGGGAYFHVGMMSSVCSRGAGLAAGNLYSASKVPLGTRGMRNARLIAVIESCRCRGFLCASRFTRIRQSTVRFVVQFLSFVGGLTLVSTPRNRPSFPDFSRYLAS